MAAHSPSSETGRCYPLALGWLRARALPHCGEDPLPHRAAVNVADSEQLVGTLRGNDRRTDTVPLH